MSLSRTGTRRAASAILAAAAAVVSCTLPLGCASGAHDGGLFSSAPTITIKNELLTPVKVTVWTSDRTRPTYAETWRNMAGRTERIDPGRSAEFAVRDYGRRPDPILRLEVETRGPSFEKPRTTWFEVLSQPSFTATLCLAPRSALADATTAPPEPALRFTSSSARIVQIPDDRILDPNRRVVLKDGTVATTP